MGASVRREKPQPDRKPAREMTDAEMAERLLGQEVVREVKRELGDAKEPENGEDSDTTEGG